MSHHKESISSCDVAPCKGFVELWCRTTPGVCWVVMLHHTGGLLSCEHHTRGCWVAMSHHTVGLSSCNVAPHRGFVELVMPHHTGSLLSCDVAPHRGFDNRGRKPWHLLNLLMLSPPHIHEENNRVTATTMEAIAHKTVCGEMTHKPVCFTIHSDRTSQ